MERQDMSNETNKDDAVIIVNGEEKQVPRREVSYGQVTELAFPGESTNENFEFTVLYRKTDQSRHEGSMVDGDVVKVHKQGSTFNVTRSIRS
jgi:hypothetical protein